MVSVRLLRIINSDVFDPVERATGRVPIYLLDSCFFSTQGVESVKLDLCRVSPSGTVMLNF